MNERHLRRSILLSAIAVLVSSRVCSALASSSIEEASRHAANERFACGRRAAVLFCTLRGIAAPQRLAADLPAVSEGTSMLDLRAALQSHGVSCELRRLNPSDLLDAPLPMIARLLPADRGDRLGHFVLVTGMEDTGPITLDPITGLSERRGWRSFSDDWSGHCILAAASTFDPQAGLILMSLSALLVLLSVPALVKKGKARLGSAALIVWVVASEAPLNASDGLRSHERDGANAAILFAAIVSPASKSLVRQLESSQPARAHSMLEVQDALEELSVPTTLRFVRFSDLVALRQPAVVLLRRDGKGRSQYGIALNASDDRVTVLHTGAVVVQELSADEFRRAWSGHVLIAEQRPSRTLLAAAAALGGMVGLMLVRTRRRCPKKDSQTHRSLLNR